MLKGFTYLLLLLLLLRVLYSANQQPHQTSNPAPRSLLPASHEERKEVFRRALLWGSTVRFSSEPRGPCLRESQETRLRQHEEQG